MTIVYQRTGVTYTDQCGCVHEVERGPARIGWAQRMVLVDDCGAHHDEQHPCGDPLCDTCNPLGEHCLSCTRVMRATDAEGWICDECLADGVDRRLAETCGLCGRDIGNNSGVCPGCRDADPVTFPRGLSHGTTATHRTIEVRENTTIAANPNFYRDRERTP